MRMPVERPPRQVMYGEFETGRRSAGGQRNMFKDNLKRSMKQFNLDPNPFEQNASDRSEWKHVVSTGASGFTAACDAAAIAQRARRHDPPTDGAHLCNECDRRFVSLAGLRSNLRAHQRKRVANDGRTEGEDDFVIETDVLSKKKVPLPWV